MRLIKTALYFATLLAIPAACQAADFFFIQMSDPQFGMYADNQNFTQETANFEFAISTANRLHPAFVVVCGDLVNKAGDASQIAEYRRIVAKLDKTIPLYSVAGNHDVGNSPTRDSLAAYRKAIGPDHYTFRHEDFEGIVLDSSVIQHPENVPDEAAAQEQWLRSELKKAEESGMKQTMIFQHIPWLLKTADEADQYFNIPIETRTKYLDLFERAGVRYVFAGHLHQNSLGAAGPLHVITTGPVGKPLGGAESGIRIVKVTGQGIEDHYYSLGDLPNRFPEPAHAAAK